MGILSNRRCGLRIREAGVVFRLGIIDFALASLCTQTGDNRRTEAVRHIGRVTIVKVREAQTLSAWWDLFREQLDQFWRTDIKKEVMQ